MYRRNIIARNIYPVIDKAVPPLTSRDRHSSFEMSRKIRAVVQSTSSVCKPHGLRSWGGSFLAGIARADGSPSSLPR